MAGLNGRLERLEAHQPRVARCVVCCDWPGIVTRYAGLGADSRTVDATPEACPACGWQPYQIVIVIPGARTWD
jgi:hypothetical protein